MCVRTDHQLIDWAEEVPEKKAHVVLFVLNHENI